MNQNESQKLKQIKFWSNQMKKTDVKPLKKHIFNDGN